MSLLIERIFIQTWMPSILDYGSYTCDHGQLSSNPTGAVYTREEIEEIVSIAVLHDLWIISDEIYSRLIWNGTEHVSPATVDGGEGRTIVVSGWSKTWAMTGMRIGFLTGPTL